MFLLLGWYRPHAFNPDLALVDAAGESRSMSELEDRIVEFKDLNLIDRSRRRQLLGIRVSTSRLRAAALPLLSTLEKGSSAAESNASPATPSRIEFVNPRRIRAAATQVSTPATQMISRNRIEELELELARVKGENEKLLRMISENAVEIAKLKASGR